MAIFKLTATVDMVVESNSEFGAMRKAEYWFRQVDDAKFTMPEVVKTVSDLPRDWDGDCLPWGGDGESTLSELL